MTAGARPKDAPVTREELERALRHVNLLISGLHDDLLVLGAQIGLLTDQLTERQVVDEQAVMASLSDAADTVRMVDEESDPRRVDLGSSHIDKYMLEGPPVPCAELLPLCHARCCSLNFVLNTQDLDEGVVCWDYARPYWIRQRSEDGYCVHNGAGGTCSIYDQRPAPCREFDCRTDSRIWTDYERRIPAPPGATDREEEMETDPGKRREQLAARVRQRRTALFFEEVALENLYGKRAGRESPPEPEPTDRGEEP